MFPWLGGNAYVKEGSLNAYWTLEYQNVKQLVLSGNRIGILDNSNNTYVKEGSLNAYWTLEVNILP
jgi:hypothetical protein